MYFGVIVFVIRISHPSLGKLLPLHILRYFYILCSVLIILQDGWKITGASNITTIPDVAVRDVAVRVEVLV